MGTDLVVSLQIETSPGTYLELENPAGGYQTASEALAQRDVDFRQLVLDTPWTEGSVVVQSVRTNVVEPVSIWVTGPDHYTFDTRVQTLTNALEQLSYHIKRTLANSLQTWDCMPAKYSILTQAEYLWATRGLVRAQVPRYPTMTIASV